MHGSGRLWKTKAALLKRAAARGGTLQEQMQGLPGARWGPAGPGCRWGFGFFRLGHTQDSQHDRVCLKVYVTSETYLEKSVFEGGVGPTGQ